jgi:hypothetical protein
VAGGGHGGSMRSVTAATAPTLLGWRWKKPPGPVGPKTLVGPVQWPRPVGLIKQKNQNGFIFEFKYISEFGKTLKNFTRRFRRNLDTRIFPKFILASQGFLENTICHAMNATLCQIKLSKNLFLRHFSQKCKLMHF